MNSLGSRKALAVVIVATAVVVGAGAAIAASGDSSPSPKSFFDAVAKHLGVSSQKLEDATKAAAIDQVDAALAQGRITKAQADALKARIHAGDYPPFFGRGFGPGFGHLHRGPPLFGERLSAAADYLGLTQAELRTKLSSGRTLANIAKARGKSVDGLKQAILDDAKAKLDAAVKEGKLTQAEADEIYARMKSHVDDLVDHGMFRFRFRDGDRLGPPPGEHPFW